MSGKFGSGRSRSRIIKELTPGLVALFGAWYGMDRVQSMEEIERLVVVSVRDGECVLREYAEDMAVLDTMPGYTFVRGLGVKLTGGVYLVYRRRSGIWRKSARRS